MPVLIEVSRFFTTAVMASRCSGLILEDLTRTSMSSSMASQRLAAFMSDKICSGPSMSPRSILREFRELISPEQHRHCKSDLAAPRDAQLERGLQPAGPSEILAAGVVGPTLLRPWLGPAG